MSLQSDIAELKAAENKNAPTYGDGSLGVAQKGALNAAPYTTPSGAIAVPANPYSRIAGPEGVAYGFQGGHAHDGNEVLKMRSDAQTARNVARVNMAYGYLPSMRGNNVFAAAEGSNALIHGEIEHTAGLARDAGAATNVAGAEAGARDASFQSANTDTVGSSVALKNKQRVLGTFLGGRAGVAQATGAMRTTATNAIEQERLGTIDNVRGQSGINLGERIADLSTIRQFGEAQHQVVPQAIGQGIGDLGQLYTTQVLYDQMNRSSPTTKLPSLSGGTTKASGGYTTPRAN